MITNVKVITCDICRKEHSKHNQEDYKPITISIHKETGPMYDSSRDEKYEDICEGCVNDIDKLIEGMKP